MQGPSDASPLAHSRPAVGAGKVAPAHEGTDPAPCGLLLSKIKFLSACMDDFLVPSIGCFFSVCCLELKIVIYGRMSFM